MAPSTPLVHTLTRVVDEALWCQSLVELQFRKMVPILDFAHAAEYLSVIAQTSDPDGRLLSSERFAELRHMLKQKCPTAIQLLCALITTQPTKADLTSALAYSETRVAQMQDFSPDPVQSE